MRASFMRQFTLFFKKELLLFSRRSTAFLSIIFFTLLIVIIFQFGIDLGGRSPLPYACSFIWLGSIFGGMLRMSRSFEADMKDKALDGIRLAKGVFLPLYLGKLFFNILFMIFLELLMFVVVVTLFNVPSPLLYLRVVWIPLVLGAIGFSAIGTTFSGMVLGEASRDLMLPVIAYPILSPLLIGVVKSLEYDSLRGKVFLNPDWIILLVAFDLAYVILSMLVFDLLLENR